ncbi:hypothetical protein ACS126_10680 [Sphingobacterium lactis]|uniref:hypothetical protein n=1 Tax=Sphingobacterium lactis TaxID=797291 RepID=UPI003EC8D1E2
MEKVRFKSVSTLDILFFLALLLNVFNHLLFEKTIVPVYIIGLLYVCGLLFYFAIKRKEFFSRINVFERLLYTMVIFGSMLSFCFLTLNYIFSKKETHFTTCKVKCHSKRLWTVVKKVKEPSVVYAELPEGLNKRIPVSKEERMGLHHIDSLEVQLSPGAFGFSIIRRIIPRNENT